MTENSGAGRIKWLIIGLTIINMFVFLVVLQQANRDLTGDQQQYFNLAQNLIEHSTFSLQTAEPFNPTIYRTPGYSLFLFILANSVILVKIIQFLLLGVISYLLFCLSKYYTDERTSKVAAILCLTYLPFLFLASLILTEILTIFLCTSLVLLIKKYKWLSEKRWALDVLIGGILGYLTLVRPSMGLVGVFLLSGFWIIKFFSKTNLSFSQSVLKSFLVGAGLLMVLSPWMTRNYLLAGKFIPLTVMTSSESLYYSILQYKGVISYKFSLAEWNEIYFPDVRRREKAAEQKIDSNEIPPDIAGLPRSIQREFLLEKDFKKSINDEWQTLNPSVIITSIPIRLAYLWSTSDYAPLDILSGFLHLLGQLQYLILILLAVVGAAIGYRKLLDQWLLWLFPVYITIIHSFFLVEGRYTIPARPFILIYCSVGIVWLIRRLGIWRNA